MRARLVLLVVACAVLLPAQGVREVAAREGPQLVIVAPSAEPYAARVTGAPGNWAATVVVIVRNESSFAGPAEAEFLPSGAGEAPALAAPKVTLPEIAPYGTFSITVTFTGTTPAAPRAFEGVIAVRAVGTTDVLPATLRVGVAPEATPAAVPAYDPAGITIVVTRWLPFGRGTAMTAPAAWLRGAAPASPAPRANLASENGSVLVLDPTIDPSGRTTFALAAPPGAGKYQGSYSANPANEKAPKLAITVNVQHAIIWPLLVLLLGVALAFRLLRWRDQRRPKDVLRAEIVRLGERYAELHRTIGAQPGVYGPILGYPYDYATYFPPGGRGYPGRRGCPPPGREGAAAQSYVTRDWYCTALRATTRADLEEVAAKVSDLAGRLELWPALGKARTTLGAALARAEDLRDQPIHGATTRLLDEQGEPGSLAAARERLARLREQPQALAQLLAARAIVAEAQPLRDELLAGRGQLAPGELLELHRQDPAAIYRVHLRQATTLGEVTASGGLPRLQEAWRTLLGLASAYRSRGDKGPPAPVDGPAGHPMPVLAVADLAARETRTAAQLLGEVRRRDWLDFLVTALVTALAFVLTLYVGKNFGTWEQYLGAFAAGATGTLVINWTLLPWYRSYRAPEPKDTGS